MSAASNDVVIQMPTDLRRDGDIELEPLNSSISSSVRIAPALDPSTKSIRRGILCLTVDAPAASAPSSASRARPPARWKSLEFIFYGAVFVVVVPVMAWKAIDLSRDSHPNFHLYAHRLGPGWLFGRPIDNSDAQYRTFRNNIPLLTAIAFVYILVKTIYQNFAMRRLSKPLPNRMYRIPFLLCFSLLFVFGLHGANILKILLVLYINYTIAKALSSSKLNPLLTWVFNVGVLFAIERNSGYRFESITPALSILDSISGAYPRWFIPFNITMLRLVSFNMDYFWAARGTSPTDPGLNPNHKQRTTTPHTLDVYSFINYLSYVLYPPLFIAGPIITFNDFMWQHRRDTGIPSRKMVARYLLRFLISLFTMELIQHYMYVVAIKDTAAWLGDTPFELSMIGVWNLIFVWLKLLLPWRFFRLWALMDGIDPPENMIRCVVNNYSTLGFWRSWHRSYNLWIVRYIYIPLGGSKSLIYTTVLVFSFVALWHDLTFRLLAWGWLVSLFILPEVMARYLLPESKFGIKPWYRHVCAIGGVANLLMMVVANLVGFVIGLDGLVYLLSQLTGTWEGVRFLLIACPCIFVGMQLMFEYREEEMRNGIFRRC